LKLRAPDPSNDTTYPATGINWIDANEYVSWINDMTGHSFRLPTSEEWGLMAHSVMPETPDPIFTDPALAWASAYSVKPEIDRKLRVSGSYSTTELGISDLDGNVWEWTADCYSGSLTGNQSEICAAYWAAGEHKAVIPFLVRDPARGGCAVGAPPAHLGMRLVSDRPVG
jgi:formylglycine-generating enzyme required for sulfatase activity